MQSSLERSKMKKLRYMRRKRRVGYKSKIKKIKNPKGILVKKTTQIISNNYYIKYIYFITCIPFSII